MKIFKNKWVKSGVFAIIALLAVLWIAGVIILKREDARESAEIERAAEEFERLREMAKADTYGGETPRETLQMFIDAVEAGDYELASKYFVLEKRGEEKIKLMNIDKQNNMDMYIDFVRQGKPWRSSLDDNEFVMKSETDFGESLFIYFIKYPSSVWKINEI